MVGPGVVVVDAEFAEQDLQGGASAAPRCGGEDGTVVGEDGGGGAVGGEGFGEGVDDVVAGDGVYSASLAITPGKGEERRRYKACETGLACGSGLESPALSVEFTSFPVGTVGGDPDSIVTLADGTQIYDDQVLMIFVEGTTEARITAPSSSPR